MKTNPNDLINPMDTEKNPFFFRVHVTGRIESANVIFTKYKNLVL